MKSTLLPLLLLLSTPLLAQVSDSTSTGNHTHSDSSSTGEHSRTRSDSASADTTRIDLKTATITIVSKNTAADSTEDKEDSPHYKLTWWDGVDIGVNGILGSNRDFQLGQASFLEPEYGRSRYIAANFGQVKLRVVKDYVGFTTGLTAQIYNWKFDGARTFQFQNDTLTSFTSPGNVTKNKLRATYLGIPLLLEINTSLDPDRSFHISAGVVGKVLIESMYKQKFSLDGEQRKTTTKGDLYFNRWNADAMLRVGYRRFTLFAQVGLVPIFRESAAPEVYPFATGFFIKI